MGYMRHHAIIATSYNQKLIREAHAQAETLQMLVSPVVETKLNGYWSFCVFPDGSKEGWDESDRGDERRDRLIEWMESQRFSDLSSPIAWAEIQYGDDERETLISRHSDETAIGDED